MTVRFGKMICVHLIRRYQDNGTEAQQFSILPDITWEGHETCFKQGMSLTKAEPSMVD